MLLFPRRNDHPSYALRGSTSRHLAEQSPRHAQPVPVGGGELLEAQTEEAADEEDTVAEPTMPLRKSLDGLPCDTPGELQRLSRAASKQKALQLLTG